MTIKQRVEKAIKEVSKEMLQHFKKDKWPLNADVYFADVARRALGIDYAAGLYFELNKHGISFKVEEGEALFVKVNNDKRRTKKR